MIARQKQRWKTSEFGQQPHILYAKFQQPTIYNLHIIRLRCTAILRVLLLVFNETDHTSMRPNPESWPTPKNWPAVHSTYGRRQMGHFTCLQEVHGAVQGLILKRGVAEPSGPPRTQQCVQLGPYMYVADLEARSQPAQSAVTRTKVQILKLLISTTIYDQQLLAAPKKSRQDGNL